MTAWQTPKPLPTPLAMSTRLPETPPASEPTPAPSIPTRTADHQAGQSRKDNLPTPKLRFAIYDLSHSGAFKFQREISAGSALQDAIRTVIHLLYDVTGEIIDVPPVRSITFILKSMGGVAYTTGSELDDEHKEIHLSLEYVDGQPDNRLRAEILGVITHEMVHVWQWSASGTPGGLIEGIADYVRLKAGFSPPHWSRKPGGTWDAGYERTGFFLEWLEEKYGAGKIVQLNGLLKGEKYETKIWKDVFGHSVDDLFKSYQKAYDESDN